MTDLAHDLLAWYDGHRRRHLPWREQVSPWRTWVSEAMLQQTRVETVIPYFDRFMARFPTADALATASLDEVLERWAGLGYYSRARHLHAAAVRVRAAGAMPSTAEALRELPGIGEYMAGAIASIAFGQAVPAVDGNVARVLSRVFRYTGTRAGIRRIAADVLPADRPGDFNQALMDLGSGVCKPRGPACGGCPISRHCLALAADQVERYPEARKRREAPDRAALAGVMRLEGRVLVARRPARGLFGGLFELPGLLFEEGAPAEPERLGLLFREQLSVDITVKGRLGPLSHRLTHMRIRLDLLELAPAPVDLVEGPGHYTALAWVRPADPDVAMSTLARKALRLVDGG